jgi:hypothetical protein
MVNANPYGEGDAGEPAPDPRKTGTYSLVLNDTPRGFGYSQSQERYYDLHNEAAYMPPFPPSGSAGASEPFMGTSFDASPPRRSTPGRSLIAIQHDQNGIRVYIEGRTRVVVGILLLVVFLVSWPGFGDRIFALVKLLVQGN